MTVEACYYNSEGLVFGADSAATYSPAVIMNHGQKILEYGGPDSTLAFMTWGMGAIKNISWRQFVAEVSDEGPRLNHSSFEELIRHIGERFLKLYSTEYAKEISAAQQLSALPNKSKLQNETLQSLTQPISGGFCIGGRWGCSRLTKVFAFGFSPLFGVKINLLPPDELVVLGMPNFTSRTISGIDPRIKKTIKESGLWHGRPEDLDEIVKQYSLPNNLSGSRLPLREIIDYVYSIIYITIKGMKFSWDAKNCGGPIEVAAITADRPFRWVCHKELGEAII